MKTSTTYEPSSDQTELLPLDNASTETEEVTTSEVTDSPSETDFSEDPLPASEPETPALNAEGKASGDTTDPFSTADPEPEPEQKRRKRGLAWIPLGIAAGLVAGALCVGLTLGAGSPDPVSAITGMLSGSVSEEEQAAGTSSTTSDGASAATSAAEEDAAAASFTKATADKTLATEESPSATEAASGTKTAGKDSGIAASAQEGTSGKAASSGTTSSGTSAGTTSDKTAATGTGSSTSSTSKPNAGSDSTAAGTQSTPAAASASAQKSGTTASEGTTTESESGKAATDTKAAAGSSENTATTAPAATSSSETSTPTETGGTIETGLVGQTNRISGGGGDENCDHDYQITTTYETRTIPAGWDEVIHHDAEYNDWQQEIAQCNDCGQLLYNQQEASNHIMQDGHTAYHNYVLYHHDLVRDAYDEVIHHDEPSTYTIATDTWTCAKCGVTSVTQTRVD